MISVVVPAYNEEAYIEACLESLLQQEVMPDEIIVVDNNSTDGTAALARKFPVRVITEKEQGMIPARNRGFNEAQYEIIAQTDADTILPTDWLKKIKENFADKKVVAVSGPGEFYDVPQAIRVSSHPEKMVHKLYFQTLKQVLHHNCLYGPNKAIRKVVWNRIKDTVCMNDNEVHEDIDLSIHVAPLGMILFDNSLVVNSSYRRWKKLQSYFEYPYRVIKSIRKHKTFVFHQRSKRFVKALMTRYLF
jgi:glycosyltransferase involved in cell wall biosynthesis